MHTPTLSGLGTDSAKLRPSLRLEDHIGVISDLIASIAAHDVVLVGHSYGGVVATGAALSELGRLAVRRLVYLDAFVPETGLSIFQMHPGVLALFESLAVEHQGIYADPAPPTALGVDRQDVADWITAQSTPMPLSVLHQPFPETAMSPRELRPEDVAYIRFRGTDYFSSTMRSAALRGWQVSELDGSHFEFVTRPAMVAAALSLTQVTRHRD